MPPLSVGMLSRALILALAGVLFPAVCAADSLPEYRTAREAYLDERAREPRDSGPDAQDRKIMQQAAEDLARRLPDPGIAVGERAPDFTLNDAFGRPVRLYDRLRDGPVVLVFYRGAWCPFCNLHLRTLHASSPAFQAHGAQLLLVTPQRPDKSREQLEKSGYPFEVLSDLDSAVMQAYNLYFELSPELLAVYTKLGLNIEDFNGTGRNVLPVPGTFVIDRQGIIRAMHADTDYRERMEPAAIVEALAGLDG